MEEASGADLRWFFRQWIYQGGHPKLVGSWAYDEGSKSVTLEIAQSQAGGLFKFPLDIRIGSDTRTVSIDKKAQTFSFPLAEKPAQISLDPNIWLLFEGSVAEKKP